MPRHKFSKHEYVFALDTFSVREVGSKYPTTIHKGTAWHADCPVVQQNSDSFSPTPPEVFPRGWQPAPVEQATAAPGEQRDSGRG